VKAILRLIIGKISLTMHKYEATNHSRSKGPFIGGRRRPYNHQKMKMKMKPKTKVKNGFNE
jgi:hypothetical protein